MKPKVTFYLIFISLFWATMAFAQTDHSETSMGFYGNGVEGGNWSEVVHYHDPGVDGDVYTWSWTELSLIGGEGYAFIFLEKLEDELWGGLQFDYEQATVVEGDAIDEGNVVDERDVGGEHANFHVVVSGVYNITLVYDAGSGESTVTINSADDSGPEMGLFGNAFEGYPDEDHWTHPGFQPHAPEIEGDLYTWTWNETGLIEGRAFIFLEAAGWGGLFFDYTHPALEGDAFDNDYIVNEQSVGGGDPNFYVAEGGVYDLVLVYDVATEGATVTINQSSGTNTETIGKVEDFALHQNYPNPFNPSTNVMFGLPSAEFVTLEVYNMIGQRVAVLLNEQMSAGVHTISFDASGLSSGMYIYRIQAGQFEQVKKMTLIK